MNFLAYKVLFIHSGNILYKLLSIARINRFSRLKEKDVILLGSLLWGYFVFHKGFKLLYIILELKGINYD